MYWCVTLSLTHPTMMIDYAIANTHYDDDRLDVLVRYAVANTPYDSDGLTC